MPLRPIDLVGEQVDVLFMPPVNPIQISGVAGCGKTTVALYRAKHLVSTYKDLFTETSVAIFTFNKSLVKYMNSLLPVIPGGYQKGTNEILPVAPGLNDIKITNFHKWAFHYLRRKGLTMTTLDNSQVYTKVKEARNHYLEHRIANKSIQFLMDEISWLKGLGVSSLEEYKNMVRTGRGHTDRVEKERDRPILWSIYQDYQKLLRNANVVDYDDYALLCMDYLSEEDRIFSHIIIDEAQDLSKMQIMCLAKLVKKETKSITIIADEAQKIYKTPFSWRQTGINIQGRTIVLNKNFRNTYEIADAAYSLIMHDPDHTRYVKGQLNEVRHGNKPIIKHFINEASQVDHLISQIKALKTQNAECSIAVLHRNNREVNTIYNTLRTNNISSQIIIDDKTLTFDENKVCVCTMSSIKGLEFDFVFILSLNENVIPYTLNIDKEDLDVQIESDRRLLYVSMTRARIGLFMYYFGTPSMFLNEIETTKVNKLLSPEEHDQSPKNEAHSNKDEEYLPF